MEPFAIDLRSDVVQDELIFPPDFEGKTPSNYQPFIGKEISQIHRQEQVDEDPFTDSKSIIDIFGTKPQKQSTQQKCYSHIKKPKSQIFSSSEPFQSIPHRQSPKNYLYSSSSKRFSTPEKKKPTKSMPRQSEVPSVPDLDYFNQIPKDQAVQLKGILKNSSEDIKEILKHQKQAYNLASIKEYCEQISEDIQEEKNIRKKFFRYCQIQTLNKESLPYRDNEEEMKHFLSQKLSLLEQKLVRLGQIERKVNSQSVCGNKQNMLKNLFTKKHTVRQSQHLKTIESRRSTEKGNTQGGAKQKSRDKLKEKTLLKDMKTIFSYNPLSHEKMTFSANNFFGSQPLRDRLEEILIFQVNNQKKQPSSKQGQKLVEFLEERNKRLARQKVNDYHESKRVLFQMVSDRIQEKLETNSMEQQELQEEKGESTGQKKLLKNTKPAFINANSLKYKSTELNREQIKKLDLIPQNCQVLYFMKNLDAKNPFYEEQIQMSRKSLSQYSHYMKDSIKVSNFCNQPNRIIKHGSMNLQQKQSEKLVNRVDRDFSPAKINKMTVSVMLPHKASLQQTPEKDEERDIYNEQNWGQAFKSSELQNKKPNPNIYRSSNLAYGQRVYNTTSHSSVIPKKLDAKALYRQAYENYKPEGPIDILQFIERGIEQKCNEYVHQKLNTNKNKHSFKNFSHLKLQHQMIKSQNNQFIRQYDDEPVEAPTQEDIEYEMRVQNVMNSWNPPRRDFLDQSQDSEIQNEEIKKFLHLGSYKAINDDSDIRTNYRLQKSSKNNDEPISTPLREWMNEFETSQKNFEKNARKSLKLHETTAQDIFNKLPKIDTSKIASTSNPTLKPSRPKIGRSPKSNKKTINVNIEMKQAISQEENEDEDYQEDKEQELPTFQIPSNDRISQLQPQSSSSSLNVEANSNNSSPATSQNTIKFGQNLGTQPHTLSNPDNSSKIKPGKTDVPVKVSTNPAPSQNPSSSPFPTQPPIGKKISPIVIQPKVEERRETKPEEKRETKTEEKRETKPEERREEKAPVNIFQMQKHQPQKNLFQQNQNSPSKTGFGQSSNIFELNSQQNQSNAPQYPSFCPPQFASFGPQQFQQPFQIQQGSKTFANIGLPGQQDNNFQQIQQQIGQQFSSSMGNFESFGPEAFRNQGSNEMGNNVGNNVFNSGNQNQPNYSSTNPFNILQGTNLFTNAIQQSPGVKPNQMQMRK